MAAGVLIALGVSPEIATAIRPAAITTWRRVGADPSYPIPAADGTAGMPTADEIEKLLTRSRPGAF